MGSDDNNNSVHGPEAFMRAMRDAGIEPPNVILADGTLHRFHVSDDKPRSENGWYVFFDNGITAGSFGSWKLGISETWSAKEYRSLTPKERASNATHMARIRKQRDAVQAEMYAECRLKSKNLWEKAHDVDVKHPYIAAKGIKAVGIKQLTDMLLIPVRDYAGTLHGLQFVKPDGSKKFKTGTSMNGNFCCIRGDKSGPVLICEGYATGATLAEATGYSVAVAFNAGNLALVANLLRRKLPKRKIIICADDDRWTEGNPGVTKATVAAVEARAFLAIPKFNDIETRPTDVNDLCKLEGIGAVLSCIEDAVYCRVVVTGDAALAKMGLLEKAGEFVSA